MAEFKVQIKCMWNSETCNFENFAGEAQSMEDNDDDDDDAEWDFYIHLLWFFTSFGKPAAAQGHSCWNSSSSAHCCLWSLSSLFSCPCFSQNLNMSRLCPSHWILNGLNRLSVNHNICCILCLTCFVSLFLEKKKQHFSFQKKLVFLFLHLHMAH